jgi:hypothetical protein
MIIKDRSEKWLPNRFRIGLWDSQRVRLLAGGVLQRADSKYKFWIKSLFFWFGFCDHLLASLRVELVATTFEAVKKSSLGYSSEAGFYDLYLQLE